MYVFEQLVYIVQCKMHVHVALHSTMSLNCTIGPFRPVKVIINPRTYVGLRYSSCLSVSQSVCLLPTMAASNGYKSETTSSITAKRGIGMGSIHSLTLFYSKAYRRNVKPEKLWKCCDFH